MEFAEKLNFLFELTQAEGKELAAALNITPPGVSKMRKGLRGLPRNRDAAYSIALFFAQRCRGNAQRDALARAMRMAQVRSAEDDVLADMLLSWFLNEKIRDNPAESGVDVFLHRLNLSYGSKTPIRSDYSQPLHSSGNNIIAYYGIEGKQACYFTFLRYLLERNKAFDICVLSDENNLWIDDDLFFASSYYDHLLRLTEQGCFFKRIVGPLNNMAQAFASLNRWFPLYLTGKATSFYYKRMRDDLNRITVFVVPDVAALYSFSVGTTLENNCVSFFTTDAKTVNSLSVLFQKYLSMCEPATKTYNADTSELQMHERMLEYENCACTCMQLNSSLSFITLPWEIAVSLRADKEPKSKDAFLTSFAKRYKVFQKNLNEYDYFDFIRLAAVDDVMAGMAPIPAASVLSNDVQYYSPAGYLSHLKGVEYLLKHRDHYHVIIEPSDAEKEPIIYVKEDKAVLITRASTPFIIFDVAERNLIDAFTENMRRRIPNDVYEPQFRKKVIADIHALIEKMGESISKTSQI